MIDLVKQKLGQILKERLPILAVDLLIDGTRAAKNLTDRSARLIADGTIPAPGFLTERARSYIARQETMYRTLGADEDWESKRFPEDESEPDSMTEPRAPRPVESVEAAAPTPEVVPRPAPARKAPASRKSSPRAAAMGKPAATAKPRSVARPRAGAKPAGKARKPKAKSASRREDPKGPSDGTGHEGG